MHKRAADEAGRARGKGSHAARRGMAGLVFLICLLVACAFGALALRGDAIDMRAPVVGGAIIFLIVLSYALLTGFFPQIDRPLLILTYLFTSVGLIILYRLDGDLAVKQLIWFGIGVAAMVIALLCVVYYDKWEKYKYAFMVLMLLLLPLSIIFGKETGGSRNWIALGGVSLQPSEMGKVLLVFILAATLREKQSVFKLVPLAIFVVVCMGLLVVQKDLGAALLYFITFVMLLYVSTSNVPLTLLSLIAAAAGAVACYYLFAHVRVRVAIWINPWAKVEDSGYQIVQALMAIASGGLLGVGLGQGLPKLIPAYQNDFIFAVICEEMGIVVGLMLVAGYLLFVFRGARVAMRAGDAFRMLLAMGCAVMIGAQTFIIIGGVIKMIPLTGVTLPFISYGGSSMLSNYILLGVLEAVAIRTERDKAESEMAV